MKKCYFVEFKGFHENGCVAEVMQAIISFKDDEQITTKSFTEKCVKESGLSFFRRREDINILDIVKL